jgi:hypothetical protein
MPTATCLFYYDRENRQTHTVNVIGQAADNNLAGEVSETAYNSFGQPQSAPLRRAPGAKAGTALATRRASKRAAKNYARRGESFLRPKLYQPADGQIRRYR